MIERYFYVENHRTGARARIPIEKGKIDFYREHRDVPVEEYVRRAKVPLSEISEWNGRDHCIFGMWESIRQDGTWDRKARQLARLQDVHGAGAGSWQNKAFEGFTGDTGFHLPVTEEIREKAKEMVDE